MKISGLSNEQVLESRKLNGNNQISQLKKHTFFQLLLESLGDPIIKILLIALMIKVVFLFKDFDWFETIGILIAVFLATFISTISEYGSEAAFRKLQQESDDVKVKVIRNNKILTIPLNEVVVNDVVILNEGDKVPADGIIIEGSVFVDESSINGETKEVLKQAVINEKIIYDYNKVFRGTIIYNKNAKMKVTEVGDKTVYGKLSLELQEDVPTSPLKIRLTGLAKIISRMGYIGAILVTISYLFSVIVINNNFNIDLILNTLTNYKLITNYLIYALTLSVTIIVVAVPEGLPMMITLVLSSNMKKMLKNNVLVRRLVGIETAGNLNVLLTDKTGTLTKGKLEVTNIIDSTGKIINNSTKLTNENLLNSLLYNNESMIDHDNNVIGGNSTDKALLKFIGSQKKQYKKIEKIEFNSELKYSAVMINDSKKSCYFKGASEKILPYCTKYIDSEGKLRILLEKEKIESNIKRYTKNGSRVVVLAYKENDLKLNALTYLGFVCIKDELRSETKEGIKIIQEAGIDIIMITGDAKDTAYSIAKDCRIIKSPTDIVLTSNELNSYTDEKIKSMLPNIKVIARAMPQDKSRLVKIIEEMNLVVGMTGDGVNDAPALKKANVGFAMGSGTEVAKEASDVIILDDNILSISKAILYGRTIFKGIRKFIIYQLTVNLCALFVSIVGPFIGVSTPITIIQMLWINMIMDTFSGLAFSFEPPLLETMQEKPKSLKEPIINKYMYSEILITGLYSALLCVIFLKSNVVRSIVRVGTKYEYLMTAYFALFIFIGIFNAFNARTERKNILANIMKNKIFLLMFSFIAIVQIYLIYNGGNLFRTYGLTLKELLFVLILAFSVIPIDILRKHFIKKLD